MTGVWIRKRPVNMRTKDAIACQLVKNYSIGKCNVYIADSDSPNSKWHQRAMYRTWSKLRLRVRKARCKVYTEWNNGWRLATCFTTHTSRINRRTWLGASIIYIECRVLNWCEWKWTTCYFKCQLMQLGKIIYQWSTSKSLASMRTTYMRNNN